MSLGDVEGPPVLDRLLLLCVDMLSVTGASLAVIGDGQHRGAIAVSSPAAGGKVDDLQFGVLGEGPCLAADAGGAPGARAGPRRRGRALAGVRTRGAGAGGARRALRLPGGDGRVSVSGC